jgi:hypothetical protein
VAKVSREIDRELPASDLVRFRRGDTILSMPFEASAGNYTIDAIAVDPEGNRASTGQFSISVPRPGRFSLSSVTIVRSIQPLDGPRDPGDPLEFEGGKVTPAVDRSATASAGVGLFFVVYPDRTAPSQPRVTVVFFQNGKAIGYAKPDVGKPDELNSFPMLQFAKLPAGNYVARVVVEQDAHESSESIPFIVSP